MATELITRSVTLKNIAREEENRDHILGRHSILTIYNKYRKNQISLKGFDSLIHSEKPVTLT